jgi:hypothetical protein
MSLSAVYWLMQLTLLATATALTSTARISRAWWDPGQSRAASRDRLQSLQAGSAHMRGRQFT